MIQYGRQLGGRQSTIQAQPSTEELRRDGPDNAIPKLDIDDGYDGLSRVEHDTARRHVVLLFFRARRFEMNHRGSGRTDTTAEDVRPSG